MTTIRNLILITLLCLPLGCASNKYATRSDLKRVDATLVTAQDKVNTVRATVREVQTTGAKKNDPRLTRASKEIDALSSTVAKAREELKVEKGKVDQITRERDALNTRATNLEKDLKQARAEIAQLKQDNKQLKKTKVFIPWGIAIVGLILAAVGFARRR